MSELKFLSIQFCGFIAAIYGMEQKAGVMEREKSSSGAQGIQKNNES
jgi:hypothetical protein